MSSIESARKTLEQKLREIIPTASIEQNGSSGTVAKITLNQVSIALPIVNSQPISSSYKIK